MPQKDGMAVVKKQYNLVDLGFLFILEIGEYIFI